MHHFATVCELQPIEETFLLLAFGETKFEESPDSREFMRFATELLAAPYPAYIFDTLFYVRAWNSYVDLLHLRHHPPMGEHIIEGMLVPRQDGPAPGPGGRSREDREARWLREFWFRTAVLCGSEPYLKVIDRLSRIDVFRERWMTLALQPGPEMGGYVSAPFNFVFTGLGSFRVSTSTVALPPAYYLREFVPVDDVAATRLNEARSAAPPKPYFQTPVHWADQ